MKERYCIKALLFLLIVSLGLMSCTYSSTEKSAGKKVQTTQKTTKNRKEALPLLHVYFFGSFPEKLGREAIKELKKIYPSVKFEGNISLPDSAYSKPRNGYLAPKLMETMMALQTNKDRVLGFTTQDISLKYKNYENWGVKGT